MKTEAFIVLAVVAAFLAIWVGYAIYDRKKGGSLISAVGGGFLASVTIVGAIPSAIAYVVEYSSTPASLQEAGLIKKTAWSDAEMKLAARVTARNLRDLDSALKEADEKGDAAAVVTMLDPITVILQTWGDQDRLRGLGAFGDCSLAAVHLANGIQSVMAAGRRQDASRFAAALRGCD